MAVPEADHTERRAFMSKGKAALSCVFCSAVKALLHTQRS